MERKIGHTFFDDQNVGSHKMTTVGVRCVINHGDEGHKIFVAKIWGHNFLDPNFL